jgi:hypothetical protein
MHGDVEDVIIREVRTHKTVVRRPFCPWERQWEGCPVRPQLPRLGSQTLQCFCMSEAFICVVGANQVHSHCAGM